MEYGEELVPLDFLVCLVPQEMKELKELLVLLDLQAVMELRDTKEQVV